MRINISTPHKMLFSGSYTVLDGHESLTLACGPRLSLAFDTSETLEYQENPFARAVQEVLQETHQGSQAFTYPAFVTEVSESTAGWGVGSSASFTTSLTTALLLANHQKLDKKEIFALTRRAHRKAQGGKGSGTDIAACTFGGLVHVSQAQGDATPKVQAQEWPEDLGVLLIRSGNKADTRQLIQKYQEQSQKHQEPEQLTLLEAVQDVCKAFAQKASNASILSALQHNADRESIWSQHLGLVFVTPLQQELQQAFLPLSKEKHVVLKALGGGGGDSIGCFFDKTTTTLEELQRYLEPFSLPSRLVQIEQQGAHNTFDEESLK